MRKYISVDRDVIAENARTGQRNPVLIVEFDEGEPIYGYDTIEIQGPSRLVYRPNSTEGRISSAWIETEAPVFVDGPIYWKGEMGRLG